MRVKAWYLPAAIALAAPLAIISLTANSQPTAQQMSAALESSVTQDSQSWFMNKYDLGSLKELQLVRQEDAHNLIVKATYTYNQGSPGWVMARITDGQVQCLQYWDRDFCKLVGPFAQDAQRAPNEAGVPNQAPSDSGDEASDPNDDLGDCMLNHGLAGEVCREFGVGIDADEPSSGGDETE